MITRERLLKLMTYDPQTGVFTRNCGRGGKGKGSIAGTTSSYYGYVSICLDRQHYKAHRLAFLYMTGAWPAEEVDHVNGNRTDNSWANLKPASRSDNAKNCALRRDNNSGHVGVDFHVKRHQWRARIGPNHLGWYDSKEEAIEARTKAACKENYSGRHGGCRTNFKNSYKTGK